MKTITLPIETASQMLAHAQSQSEEEICGLIAAKNGRVTSVYPVPNVSPQPACLYAIDAKTQVDVMRSMREKGETLFAIYHSHPSSSAYPSATDLREAQYPEAVYFIVSLFTEGVLDLRAYRLKSGKIEKLQVVTV